MRLDWQEPIAISRAKPPTQLKCNNFLEITMTDTAKEEIRTRWAPHELEMVALRMVELQAANPALGDLEAVRQAQMVLERQRVINQWQNAKRLDPILARLRAELAAGTLKFDGAPDPVPVAPIIVCETVAVIEKPAPAWSELSTIAAQGESMALTPPTVSEGTANETPNAAVNTGQAEESAATLALPAVVMMTPLETCAIESKTDIVENASMNEGEGTGFDDEDIEIDLYVNDNRVPASSAFEPPHDIVDDPEPIAQTASTSLQFFARESEHVSVSEPELVVAVKAVAGHSLPTADGIQRSFILALSAMVPTQAVDIVLRSLAIEGPLQSLSFALEKAFADERAGVLDQEPGQGADVPTDTKIFVAGFAGNEQKSIENALSRYDVRVWTPSKGPQAFESMAKACTIAVISEAMGDDVDELLRSLKIRVVQHQGSTSRLAERIAEMA